MRKQLAAAAREVVAEARLVVPTSGTGAFDRSVRVGYGPAGRPAVVSYDHFAHLIEFGSINNPPYSPFRIGARTAGLRFSDVNR